MSIKDLGKICLLSALGLLVLSGCEENSDDPAFDTTPAIRIVEYQPDTLIEFVDTLFITIEYMDGDGDLGNSNPDVNTLFVRDSRLMVSDEYYVPPLAPEDSEISIQGLLQLAIEPVFLLGNGDQESIIYSIHAVDRQGNQSNTVETDKITVIR